VSSAQDLMERLGAAGPATRTNVPTDEHDRAADALLARLLDTPVDPGPARLRRRWVQLAAASAVVAVAAFAALSILDTDDGPGPNVVANAVAALTQKDAIYHAVSVGHMRTSGRPEDQASLFQETWHTTSGRMRSKSYASKQGRKGRLLSEIAGQRRPGRLGGPALLYEARRNTIFPSGFGRTQARTVPNADPFDPGRSLRQFQAEGRLRVAGEVEVGGKRAYRLESGVEDVAGGARQRTVIIVDARTYLPLEQRLFSRAPNGMTARAVFRYLTYERLPLNGETSSLLDLHAPANAKCSQGTSPLIRKGSLGYPNPCAR
jgi:hypothetical protein